MSLRYRLVIEGLLKDGHPTQFFEGEHDTAFALGKEMAKQYPERNVRLFENFEKEVGFWEGKKEVTESPVCPLGHSGTLLNGRPVWDGSRCGICGKELKEVQK